MVVLNTYPLTKIRPILFKVKSQDMQKFV